MNPISQTIARGASGPEALATDRQQRLRTIMRRVAWMSGLRLAAAAEDRPALRKGLSQPAALALMRSGYGLAPGAETAPVKGAAAIALYNGQAHFVVDAIGQSGVARSVQRQFLEKGAGQVGLVLVTDQPLDGTSLEPGVRLVACRP